MNAEIKISFEYFFTGEETPKKKTSPKTPGKQKSWTSKGERRSVILGSIYIPPKQFCSGTYSSIRLQKKTSHRFRRSYTFSFDFTRTVWWCPFCSIDYVWLFMELQLTALSALAPTQGTHTLIGAGLNRNYTGNRLTNVL